MNPDNLRNWLSSVASDLRARRLLPVLVILIAAAVAIPLFLSHSGTAASVPPLPAASTVTAPRPDSGNGTARRHEPAQDYLSGPSHNPFVEKTTSTASAAASTPSTSTTAASPVTTASSGAKTSTVGVGHTAGHPTGTTTVAKTVTVATRPATTTVSRTTTVPAKLAYSNYQVEASLLQAGAATSPTVFHNLSRDQLLPLDSDSFAAFLGVRTDLSSAVFVLSDDATVTGDGSCAPSATSCTFLTLSPGQTVTVLVAPSGGATATYTLSYIKVAEVKSNASTVTVDEAGAADVRQASAYVRPLKSIRYSQYTGLLSIELGSIVPVTH